MNLKIILFYHSLVSDWNHGNAHFLRGIASELVYRGHDVRVFEPEDGWSRNNLIAEHGTQVIDDFFNTYPELDGTLYDLNTLDLHQALDGADLVIVHEWNDPRLVQAIGKHHATFGDYCLLFHDTHHRSVSDRTAMAAYDLSHYDGVLAYGQIIRDIYLQSCWTHRAWVWHEAADTRQFHPATGELEGDLVWIGNWGDDERTSEIHEFLIEPIKSLGLKAKVYGVRYPASAIAFLEDAGIEYGGWLPNYLVPSVFSRFKLTVHIPRQFYSRELTGIPTIRMFEALACGIPLISAPWEDTQGLFNAGLDYWVARNGRDMKNHLQQLLQDGAQREVMTKNGLKTIHAAHTCAHRVDELLRIYEEVG